MQVGKLIRMRYITKLKEITWQVLHWKPCRIHTHIGIRYDESSSKKGKKAALNVLISVPNISPTYTDFNKISLINVKDIYRDKLINHSFLSINLMSNILGQILLLLAHFPP